MPAETAKLSPIMQATLAAVRVATEGMTDDQLAWHPEGNWSTAGILEHLSLAYSRTAERMKNVPQQALPESRSRTLREWAGTIIVLKLGRIPAGRKAPETLVPKGMHPAEARISVEEKLGELDRIIEQCEMQFGKEKKVLEHNLFGPLSTSEWRRFHCIHTLHHLKQIHALREKMKDVANSSPAVRA